MAACEEYLELISRYVDNDLSADEAEALFEHLSHCPNCSEALSSFDELRMMTRETLGDVPEQLGRGVMASVDAAKKRPWFARYRFTAVAAVFALVILGLSATPLSRYFTPQAEPQVLADEAASTPVPTEFSAGTAASPAPAREIEPSVENGAVEEALPVEEQDAAQAQPEAKLAAEEPVSEPEVEDMAADSADTEQPETVEVDPALLPHTPYERTFSSYLVFTAAEAPEVLYEITSDQIVDHVIYYIVSPEQLTAVQSALLEDGMEVSVIPGDPESEEALLILTIEE